MAVASEGSYPIDLTGLVVAGTVSAELAQFLTAAVLGRCSMIVAGGMWTGKTEMLACLCGHIPATESLTVVEEYPELGLLIERQPIVRTDFVALRLHPSHPGTTGGRHLRSAAPPGGARPRSFSMSSLMACGFKLHPERLVVGEIRGNEYAHILAGALGPRSTGSPLPDPAADKDSAPRRAKPCVMATLHHVSGSDRLLQRLEACVSRSPSRMGAIRLASAQMIDLVIYMEKPDGRHCRVSAVDEVTATARDGSWHIATTRIWQADGPRPATLIGQLSEPLKARLEPHGGQ